MYKVIEILVRKNREWRILDNINRTISEYIDLNDEVLLTYLDDTNREMLQLDLKDAYRKITVGNGHTLTIASDIFNFGFNLTTISTTKVRSLNNVKKIRYNDLFETELTANRCNYRNGNKTKYLPDIKITFINKDRIISPIQHTRLFTVNGRVTNILHADNALYILDGCKMLDSSKNSNIGVIDFTALGGIEILPIKDCIYRYKKIDGMASIEVTLPKSIINQAPLLVLDGILYPLDSVYRPISENQIMISIDIDTLIKFCDVYDNTTTWIMPISDDYTGFDKETVDIPKLLELDNSFIVLINANKIYTSTERLSSTKIPARYTHYTVPTGLMYFDTGELAEYIVTGVAEYGVEISTSKHSYQNRLSNTDHTANKVNNATLQTKLTCVGAYTLDLYTF